MQIYSALLNADLLCNTQRRFTLQYTMQIYSAEWKDITQWAWTSCSIRGHLCNCCLQLLGNIIFCSKFGISGQKLWAKFESSGQNLLCLVKLGSRVRFHVDMYKCWRIFSKEIFVVLRKQSLCSVWEFIAILQKEEFFCSLW